MTPNNGYAARRLERYLAWQELPEVDFADGGDLVEVGRRAFTAYPAQTIGRATFTCATCHTDRGIAGLGARVDIGKIVADETNDRSPALLAWGPGRADVATLAGDEPIRFPDLRATRFQTHLQVDAAVEQRDIVSLALRIETLLITASGEVNRPSHRVAMGLAQYLWSLAPAPPSPPATDAERRGEAEFSRRCIHCHAPPTYAGPPVPLAAVGIDAVGLSAERGTGTWRVPSLRGVGDRTMLFHDGKGSLEQFDPDLVAFLKTL